MYLGAEIKKVKTTPRHEYCCISYSKYIKYAFLTIEDKLQKKKEELPKYCNTTLSYRYQLEHNIIPKLQEKDTTFYQEAISMLRWDAKIGILDILFGVSIMSSYMAAPRIGHLQIELRFFHGKTFTVDQKGSRR